MIHPAFAVIVTVPHFCSSTDAYQCDVSFVFARHPTKAEALAQADFINESDRDSEAHVEMRPYREGEEEPNRPAYNLLELRNHDAAVARDGQYDPQAW